MKNFVTVCLILIILLQGFVKGIIVAHYQLNKQYIAAVLCENKNQPQKHCNGKCYLNKSIKAEEKREQKIPMGTKVQEIFTLFCSESLSFESIKTSRNISFNSFFLLRNYLSPTTHIFQPPKV